MENITADKMRGLVLASDLTIKGLLVAIKNRAFDGYSFLKIYGYAAEEFTIKKLQKRGFVIEIVDKDRDNKLQSTTTIKWN